MIFNENIPQAGKTILRTSATVSYAVTSIFFCNTSGDNLEKLNLYIVKAGETQSDASLVVKDLEVKPADTFTFDTEKLILEAGDYIYGTSLNGTLSATLSVMNMS